MSALITKLCDLLYLYSLYRANGHGRRRSFKIARSLMQR